MNRLGKNTLILIALLLAAVVAYFSDPVLSDPSRATEIVAPSTVSSNTTATTTQATATSTPPTATTTPAANIPPTVDVMTFRGDPFPDDHTHKINISGSKVSIRLRGLDDDGNLDYLAILDEDNEEQGRSECDSTMGSECILEVTIPSPAEYERAFPYFGIAVDREGEVSEKSIRIEITSILDKGSYVPSSSSMPRPPGRPPTQAVSPDPILTIDSPAEFDPFIANLPSVIRPQVTYVGSHHLLSYSLSNEPMEMTMDSDNGIITWTPQESDEGQTFDITVHVTDGDEVAQTTFQVTVVEPEELETEITESETDGNKLTVTDAGTSLKGLVITSPTAEEPIASTTLEELQQVMGKATAESVPPIPAGIIPISDVFVISGTFEKALELSFPLSALPDGVSIGDVDLYAYVDASDVQGKFWSPVLVDFSFEGTLEEPIYVVELAGLEGMGFFGYRDTASPPTQQSLDRRKGTQSKSGSADGVPGYYSIRTTSITVTPPMTGEISCVEETVYFAFSSNWFTCTASSTDPDIEVTIKDFPNGTGWADDATVEQLARWIITAQLAFNELGLGYNRKITVDIEDTSFLHRKFILGEGIIGYVVPFFEGRRTLHLTKDPSLSAETIRSAVFHEYFHHAQGHDDTRVTIGTQKTSLFAGFVYGPDYADWLLEGTANWFMDEVEDDLNKYTVSMNHDQILEVGLDSLPSPDFDTRRNPYDRFAFFKLLTERCTNFQSHMKNLLNDRSVILEHGSYVRRDRTGIENLNLVLEEADCDFGNHLGMDRSGSIEAAIAYYNYATQLKQSIAVLEPDEVDANGRPVTGFNVPTSQFPIPQLPNPLPKDYFLESQLEYLPPVKAGQMQVWTEVGRIPAAGAFSVNVLTLGRKLDGTVVELVVEPDRGELIVSMTSQSNGFISKHPAEPESPDNFIGPDPDDEGPEKPDAHAWFSTSEQTSYVYSRTALPSIFVTVINPSLDNDVQVVVLLRIRPDPEGPFARDPASEFNFGNEVPWGIWSDETTMWVADSQDDKIYAYSMSTRQRDYTRDFNTLIAAGNDDPRGIWSDETTMWVADDSDDKLYAYSMSTGQRDSSQDFNTLTAAGNEHPRGIWSNGTTMWVADSSDDKIYAYSMSTGRRDSSKDFDTLDAAENNHPTGIWSNGTTMWVADLGDDKIYAYSMLIGQRDSSKDFDTLDAADNDNSHGIWSNRTTMWVADRADNRLYAYSMSTRQRDSAKDFDALEGAGNEGMIGVWSNETTMWVADWFDQKLYAFSMSTRQHDSAKDFDALDAAGNDRPTGIWSDGTTMWVADLSDDKLYAYSMSTRQRDPDKDFDTLEDAGNEHPRGIWSNRATMWVADSSDDKLYAYSMSTRQRDPSKDFNTLTSAGDEDPQGIWSDETTMWVSDDSDDKLYAYSMFTRQRDPSKDFDTLEDANNEDPQGIWSDGTTMWVADFDTDRLYAYNMP